MRSILFLLIASQCVFPALAVGAVGQANPKIPFYGYGAITANPASPIAGQTTDVSVTVTNDGTSKAVGVSVKLSFNDWGVSFSGWQEIGTQEVDIAAGESATLTFSHVFESRAHTCLEAKIVDWNEDAGNTATTDDRGQINLEVLQCDGECGFFVPIMNGGEQQIEIDGLEVLCRREKKDGEDRPCDWYPDCDDDDGARICDGLDNDCDGIADLEECPKELQAAIVIPGRTKPIDKASPLLIDTLSEVAAELVISGVEKRTDVVIQASSQGELNHVVVQIQPVTVRELLNGPLFCCIADVRIRASLEGLLAVALDAFEAGEAAQAEEDLSLVVEILRLFIEDSDSLQCELSEAPEADCVQQAIRKVVDAIRIIARANLLAGREAKIATGDQFRRAGAYGAACTSYQGGFDQKRISANHQSAKKRIRQNAVRRLRR